MIQYLIVILAYCMAAQSFSATASAGEKLRIATEGAYEPYNFINAQNELDGFDVDISHALCKVMGRECELIAVAWGEIIDGLVAHKYDAVVAQMAKTPEREKLIDFTDYYSRSSTCFVGRAKSGLAITEEKLTGKKIGAQPETYQLKYLKNHYGNIATIVLYDTIDETMAALVKGEIDLVLTDSLYIFNFLNTEEGKNFDFIGQPLPADDPSATAYIAIRKGDAKLKNDFNTALKAIRLNGTFNRINNKYFPFYTY